MFCKCTSFCISKANITLKITDDKGNENEIPVNTKHISMDEIERQFKGWRIRYYLH